MAAGPPSPTTTTDPLSTTLPLQQPPPMLVSDSFAKDAILAWFRGEFAAANAIIDALCAHLAHLSSSASDYNPVFAAIHRRRLNWIPVLQMQNGRNCRKWKDGDHHKQLHDGAADVTRIRVRVAGQLGSMVNVVKGLKLYEDIFTDSELCKLTDFVNEIHAAGQNGELSGETFILFNKQMKGNKRELIQLGVPIFGQIKEDEKSNIEPIPELLQRVIDHLIQWKLLPEYKRPNGCIINFFEEGEFSQPFLKPPHLDQPVSTLLLSESTMAFGRILMSENDGNYKGPLMLSLKKGSLLVMRGNSADMARHVMCPSPNRRVSITFFRVRPDSNQCQSPTPTMTNAMTLWQPGIASPYALPNGYEGMDMMMPKWGMLRGPMVMLTPMRPMALNPRKLAGGGTGVFLPWNVPSRKPAKHLPPRAQKGRLLALPSPVEPHMGESTSEPSICVEG
ncbi:Oxoglutarate/iron-dependent dioxygenase [Sesbania bispinosa]|nr:Oxoglutarate/iron-dependent dioxygenase [Sesbania bispinosa]